VRSNRSAPANQPGRNAFDSHTVLADEGQRYQNLLGLTASSAASVVFRADLGSVPGVASGWRFSMGGRGLAGVSTIGVDVSLGCDGYRSAGSFQIGEADERFSVGFGDDPADVACVRLNFPNPTTGQAIVDNVMLHAFPVPEPGGASALFAAVGGLLVLRLHRSPLSRHARSGARPGR